MKTFFVEGKVSFKFSDEVDAENEEDARKQIIDSICDFHRIGDKQLGTNVEEGSTVIDFSCDELENE